MCSVFNVCEVKTRLRSSPYDRGNSKWIFKCSFSTDAVLLEVAVALSLCGQVPHSAFFFLSLTWQNSCCQSRANIPSFLFPRGKVPFSLPAWEKNTKAGAILDYSLVDRFYLFQFSLQIAFPCPVVGSHVLGQPLLLCVLVLSITMR